MGEVSTAEDCVLCDLSTQPESPFDVSQRIGDDLQLVPTLGMLVPGYFLAVASEHITSFSQLSPDRLESVDGLLTQYESHLAARFGSYFRLEHGSDNITTCGSGGCLDHAHIHLVPANQDVGTHIREQLPWEELPSYESLSRYRGSPYIYLGRAATAGEAVRHYVVPDPKLPGQWVRRQIAEVRGLDNWDWATYQGARELLATFYMLGRGPLGRLVVSGDQATLEPKGKPRLIDPNRKIVDPGEIEFGWPLNEQQIGDLFLRVQEQAAARARQD